MRRLALVLSVLMLLLVASDAAARPGPPSNHLIVRGDRIEDGNGRTVLLRGVNVNQLGDYFAANPAVPPTLPFSHNPGWDGAPEWATITDGLSRCRLFIREASAAAAQAWQSFWLDRPAASDPIGIQEHLVRTWAWLAGAFKNDPTVVGYDLLNEPNPGWGFNATEATLLGEYHRRALEAIRHAERGGLRKIVFFEPAVGTWTALGVGVPRPWTSDDQIVYAPHIYIGSSSLDKAVTGREVIPLRHGFEQARRDAAVYGTTFWVGEWAGDGDWVRRFAALEDEFQVGSAFWQWKQACGDPHGVSWPDGRVPAESGDLVRVRCRDPAQPAGVEIGLVEGNRLVLSRPYPRAFPGRVTFTSDPVGRRLVLHGRGGRGKGPLEVWIPGTAAPTVGASGLDGVTLTQVPGGWLLHATPAAPTWSLEATGSVESEGRRCLAHRSPIGPRNIGHIRLGYSRRRLLRLRAEPIRKTRRSYRYCVKRSSGTVRAVFSRRGRVVLVATTARSHGNRGVRPGASARRMRRAYPRRRAVGRGLYRVNRGSPRLVGIRKGRVRFVAVANRALLRKRHALKRHLRLAGL